MSKHISQVSETQQAKGLALPLGMKVTARTNNSRLALAPRVLFLRE
jgi:hypothetical protein